MKTAVLVPSYQVAPVLGPVVEALGAIWPGAVIVVDYETHRDDALREQQADLWLGFEPAELAAMARDAGLVGVDHGRLPKHWNGDGPDRHLDWHWLAGRRGVGAPKGAPSAAP